MTIGPDNFGNGAPKNDDRFASQLGQYRPGGRRDAVRQGSGDGAGGELMARNGGALDTRNGTNVLDNRNGAAPVDGRNAANVLDGRGGPNMLDGRSVPSQLDAHAPIASSIAIPKLPEPMMRDPNPLTDSAAFPREPWLDPSNGSLADHPLLRGLLMELPPKGTVPPAEYLDRWFEAARSILDLLYAMNVRS